jgi:hypothetical protein
MCKVAAQICSSENESDSVPQWLRMERIMPVYKVAAQTHLSEYETGVALNGCM